MNIKRSKTYSAKLSELQPQWQVIDAAGKPLGRVASNVALLLQGKHKPTYTPHLLSGDFVIVVNASDVAVSGRKMEQKLYYRHTGYPGGLRTTPLRVMLEKHPDRVLRLAIRGMLPKTTLGRKMLRRLKVYPGPDHPHEAQVIGSQRRPQATPEAAPSQEVPEATQTRESAPRGRGRRQRGEG